MDSPDSSHDLGLNDPLWAMAEDSSQKQMGSLLREPTHCISAAVYVINLPHSSFPAWEVNLQPVQHWPVMPVTVVHAQEFSPVSLKKAWRCLSGFGMLVTCLTPGKISVLPLLFQVCVILIRSGICSAGVCRCAARRACHSHRHHGASTCKNVTSSAGSPGSALHTSGSFTWHWGRTYCSCFSVPFHLCSQLSFSCLSIVRSRL